MKQIINVFTLILAFSFFGCSFQKEVSYKENWDTSTVLENPHKGWYHHLLDNGIERYAISNDSIFASFPGMDHLYLRLAWSYLEPEEGKYDWHRIDEVVDKYVPMGYGISFRISSKETGTYPGVVGQELNGVQYATPVWVMQAGAKGTVAEEWNVKSWTPVWNDPVYLEKLNNFHKAFSERYDGKPWVRYIDIGSIGEWGEGHTFYSTKIPPTVTEVKANMDVFLRNYKYSQLACTDDLLYYGKPDSEVSELLDYALSNGITLRDDSPMVDWYVQQHLSSWSISHPHFYDPLYLHKPIVFELQHYGDVKKDGNWIGKNGNDTIPKLGHSGAEIMRNAIKTMHASYIGYHGFAEEWLYDNPDLTGQLANLCGYWYFPVTATFPKSFHLGENKLSIEWLNKGVAPAYHEYKIIFRLESEHQESSFDLSPINSGNLNWFPDVNRTTNYTLNIPQEINSGSYMLKFKLVDQTKEKEQPVLLGVDASIIDESYFIELGNVKLN